MYIIIIAWIYVVFMMAITESSAVAGVMTFLLYGMLPVSIIFYIGNTGKRRQRRKARDALRAAQQQKAVEKEEPHR